LPNRIDDDLRAKGFDPNQIREQINKHVQGTFGSLENYASAIQSKPPDKLSDPQAAAALQALSPALFGQGIGADPQRPGVMSFDFGQTAAVPQGAMDPRAADMLNAIGQHQQANPFTIPVAPGTKARWQINDEEAMRAQQAAEALAGEKWDWQKQQAELDRQMQEREFAAQQAYRNAQLAASRAGGAGGAAATPLAGATKYQYAIQNAIDTGESLENIVKDIKGAVPEMLNEKINPSDVMRYAVEQFGQRYEGQRVQPGQDMDIKWFQNYKWYLDNLDKLLKEAGALEQRFQPIGGSEGAEGAGLYTPEEKRRLAMILGISLSDVDLYIKTNPNLIKELLSKKYGTEGGGLEDSWEKLIPK
jgi:hypothetical protein